MNLAYYLSKQKFTAIVLKLSTYRGRAFLHGFLCILHLEKMPVWRKYRDGSIIRSGRHLLVIVRVLNQQEGSYYSVFFLSFEDKLWLCKCNCTLVTTLLLQPDYWDRWSSGITRFCSANFVGITITFCRWLQALLCHLSANFDRDKQVILVLPKGAVLPARDPKWSGNMDETTPRALIQGVLTSASVSKSVRVARGRSTPSSISRSNAPPSAKDVASQIITRTRSATKRKAPPVSTPSAKATPRTLVRLLTKYY